MQSKSALKDLSDGATWIPQRAAAVHLGISERTLQRWRSAGLLIVGVHYRRKFPSSNSPLLYQLERCEIAMNEACFRKVQTLELAI
jgi:hypothetical protein